jgi:hypothetical protein|tara:strand:- start:634 stop:906 length:273 start_codon:yes stop_codon:yes gene_type:complete
MSTETSVVDLNPNMDEQYLNDEAVKAVEIRLGVAADIVRTLDDMEAQSGGPFLDFDYNELSNYERATVLFELVKELGREHRSITRNNHKR